MKTNLIEAFKGRANPRSFELLSRQSGVTLIESLVLVLVIAVLVISVYIGIIYAEKQLVGNSRDRVATLLIAGELEMEYYRHTHNQDFQLQVNKDYVLDYVGKDRPLRGQMTIELKNAQESSNSQLLNFFYLEGTFRWRETTSQETRYIRLREDYFPVAI